MQGRKYTPGQIENYSREATEKLQSTIDEQNKKIISLQRENARLTDELNMLKKKDKAANRALVLAERKAKYIGDVTKSRCAIEIDRLTRLSQRYVGLFEQLDSKEQQKVEQFSEELATIITSLGGLKDYIDDRKPLSDAEKNYIAEKERISLESAVKSDLDDRFNKLVTEFKQKIGESATRGRGRPKKSDQSIVVDVKRVVDSERAEELSAKEKQEVIEKINQLFYAAAPKNGANGNKGKQPKQKGKKAPTFDFDEALNPTDSLADIMKDLQ